MQKFGIYLFEVTDVVGVALCTISATLSVVYFKGFKVPLKIQVGPVENAWVVTRVHNI